MHKESNNNQADIKANDTRQGASQRAKQIVVLFVIVIVIASAVSLQAYRTRNNQASSKYAVVQEQVELERQRLKKIEAQKMLTEQKENAEAARQKQREEKLAAESALNSERAARPTADTRPGDLISYNPKKNAKTFWQGSLRFSTTSVTYSKSTKEPTKVVVSTSDGKAITSPTKTWDDTSLVEFGYRGNTEGLSTSWTIYVSANDAIALGSYKLYVISTIPSDTARYEYSGYITVRVVE